MQGRSRRRRWCTSLLAALALVVVAAGCSVRDEPTVAVPEPVSDVEAAPTTVPSSLRTAPTSPPTTAPPCPTPEALDSDREATPGDLVAALDQQLTDPRFARHQVSASIWVDGWGEVVARGADDALLPASNQKLLTAMGALDLLDPEARLSTRVVADGSIDEGVVRGDLIIVGGGDPTFRRTGSHSIAVLADRVRAVGVRRVDGSIVVDESRWDDQRAAAGWLSWHRPGYAGSLSALLVDGNRYRGDAGFLADPASANGMLLRNALEQRGVGVTGGIRHGHAPPEGVEIARLDSPTVRELLHSMLLRSDNVIAEAIVKEIGVAIDGIGSTAGGLAATTDALRARCLVVDGVDSDGSGLSRQNFRSAREWRLLLQAATTERWGDELVQLLPVAGRSGTLSGRLGGPATAGNVRAKTGSIGPARALSGYFTTEGGRPAVFSVVVNGSAPGGAVSAIDTLVTTVAAHPG